MASRTFIAAVVGVALIAACDVSQKTPQTAPPVADLTGRVIPAGTVNVGHEGRNAATLAGPAAAAAGDKSIRLQGPGVSRARQIRV